MKNIFQILRLSQTFLQPVEVISYWHKRKNAAEELDKMASGFSVVKLTLREIWTNEIPLIHFKDCECGKILTNGECPSCGKTYPEL